MNAETRSYYVNMAIKAGFKVYQQDATKDTWFYYTDGKNIGYCQFPDRDSPMLSTVHMPNRSTGTGYQMLDRWEDITPSKMHAAMLCHSPAWASSADRASVKKWRDWDHFHAASAHNSEYKQVTA